MQGQAQQQAYDRGITIFSPDGRLYQVEYAREAVKRGTASVGVRTEDGVVIAADRDERFAAHRARQHREDPRIDSHVGVASAGHVADARQLIDVARRQSQVNRLRYDEPACVGPCRGRSRTNQQYTQTGGARPFGDRAAGRRYRGRRTAPVRDGPLGDALRVEGSRHRRLPR